MSRIGKAPVTITKGVEVAFNNGVLQVKGPKGQLSQEIDSAITITIDNGEVAVTRSDDHKNSRSKH
ncbi:MAG: 50S ribosomal protein L6, partial [Flavobacteriales bacterium]